MIPQRQTGASSRARETHGVMPNPRQVASEGKRSPSSKSALHKGFRTSFAKWRIPGVGLGLTALMKVAGGWGVGLMRGTHGLSVGIKLFISLI